MGKMTLVRQVTGELDFPVRFASAYKPSLRDPDWLVSQWEAARFELAEAGGILVIDEIQKIKHWSDFV